MKDVTEQRMATAIAAWYAARTRVFSAASRPAFMQASGDLWEREQELIAIASALQAKGIDHCDAEGA